MEGAGVPKRPIARILDQLGWNTEDTGSFERRAIEPVCRLWCIPGVAKGDWSPHAFKLLR
jgi:8-hydroxy-5-deazaflavin:NADPH oxidoreductase